jgi:hypothetical protein
MAARANKIRHDEETRRRIKTMVIVQRLMKHIESDEPLMDASQVSAAKALLNKCLPDLRAIEITGEDGGPIETITKVELIAKAHDNSSD